MRSQRLALNRLLEAQGGLATGEQMLRLGLSLRSIESLRDRKHLLSVLPNVYRSASAPFSWLTEVAAAALFLGNRATASKATAARLHGLPTFESTSAVEFSCIPESRGIGGRITVHSTRRLDEVDRTLCRLPEWGSHPVPEDLRHLGVIRTVTVTTPCRTIIDLADGLSVPALARLVDSSISLRKTTHDELLERVDCLRDCGVRGVRKMDQVLIDAGVESWLERKFLELLREHGLPRPRCQVVFKDDHRTVARVDFLFDGTNVIVEVSGRRGHVTDAERQKDARRRNALQRAGFIVLEFTTADVVDDGRYVVESIQRALAATS